MVRGAIVLPHGTGRSVRILVFAKGEKEQEAREAGADHVGAEDLAKKIQDEGWLEFDRVIATPDMMGVVGRLGRVLGPRGLMPNPKLGTVTMDVARAVVGEQGRQGRVPGRQDRHHPRLDRQALVRRREAAGERDGAARRDPAREAGGGEGHLPQEGRGEHHHGAGDPHRPRLGGQDRGGLRRLAC